MFSYICLAFGGVVPNAGAILFSNYVNLSTCYAVPAIIGIMIFASALNLSDISDAEDQEFMNLSFKEKLNFNKRALKQAFLLEPLRKTILFFIIFLMMTPSFKDFLDYFYNFDPVFDAFIEIIVFLSVLIATIIYSEFLEDTSMRTLIRFSIFALLINSVFNVLLVMN